MSQVKMTPSVGRNCFAIWVFALLCLTGVAAVSAETTVPINESVTFSVAENGQGVVGREALALRARTFSVRRQPGPPRGKSRLARA